MFRTTLVLLLLVLGLVAAGPALAQPYHSADTGQDRAISLNELLRIIQFFNSPGLHCVDTGEVTEDGYKPGTASSAAQRCTAHDSDYAPLDWLISLSELLRLIQFFNSGGYHVACGTEDFFAPGPGTDVPCDVAPIEMVAVAAGIFDMGRTDLLGDDRFFGNDNELPVHTVTLSAYEIGKFEVTNQQVCDVFNWAKYQGYLGVVNGDGPMIDPDSNRLLNLLAPESQIEYAGGAFRPKTRMGGPNGTTPYSMADHPVVQINWYGAIAFCNWLSEIEGLTPVYEDLDFGTANFANDGYHLPTEAQWERAAAWDVAADGGPKHWVYSFTSNTMTTNNRATYGSNNLLGLMSDPTTTPVGWFNGINVNPNGGIATVHSPSPVGAYDMSGNVWEWCNDRYDAAYYATVEASGTDPEGPTSSLSNPDRVIRGGGWNDFYGIVRSASRYGIAPHITANHGFRIAR